MESQEKILSLFHHVHHRQDGHEVHHCGGDHVELDQGLDYTIRHCACGLHSIDKISAIGHACDRNLCVIEVKVIFLEICPEGGWHLESGQLSG